MTNSSRDIFPVAARTETAEPIEAQSLPSGSVLRIREPGTSGWRYEVLSPERPILIGRGPAQPGGLGLDDNQISTKHARIEMNPFGQTSIIDLGSKNGTSLNRRRLLPKRPYMLIPGDVIEFGRSELLFSQIPQQVPAEELNPGRQNIIELGTQERFGKDTLIVVGGVCLSAYKNVSMAARQGLPTLLRGATGTGKELAAMAFHRWSNRHNKPFIVLNCPAIPLSLAESMLFGHEKGAFTDAKSDHVGKVAQANGGVLFLDEVGDLDIAVQKKLLRFLQSGGYDRAGGSETYYADVIVISATNRNLEAMIAAGQFREDLYYRLAQHVITLPDLQEYGGHISQLAAKLIEEYASKEGKRMFFSKTALDNLTTYDWPGNIRQLVSLINICVKQYDDNYIDWPMVRALLPASPPKSILRVRIRPAQNTSSRSLKEVKDAAERERTIEVLGKYRHVTHALKELGIKKAWLYKKCKRWGIEARDYLLRSDSSCPVSPVAYSDESQDDEGELVSPIEDTV